MIHHIFISLLMIQSLLKEVEILERREREGQEQFKNLYTIVEEMDKPVNG
jgi:hypothetical protein